MVWSIIAGQRVRSGFLRYSVWSFMAASASILRRSSLGGLGAPSMFRLRAPSPYVPRSDWCSSSNETLLLHTVQTSEPYAVPFFCIKTLKRITRSQHTGIHRLVVVVESKSDRSLGFGWDYTLKPSPSRSLCASALPVGMPVSRSQPSPGGFTHLQKIPPQIVTSRHRGKRKAENNAPRHQKTDHLLFEVDERDAAIGRPSRSARAHPPRLCYGRLLRHFRLPGAFLRVVFVLSRNWQRVNRRSPPHLESLG